MLQERKKEKEDTLARSLSLSLSLSLSHRAVWWPRVFGEIRGRGRERAREREREEREGTTPKRKTGAHKPPSFLPSLFLASLSPFPPLSHHTVSSL
jgi:hypothetical protein